jgi:rhodanese-related sulfurtransferase
LPRLAGKKDATLLADRGRRPIGFSPTVELCENIEFPAHGGRENEMATSVKQMMEAANAAVPKITPAQAKEMIAKGNTLVVDVRDGTEVAASGKVAGAVHVSRGLLEFRADPELPSHDKNFAKDKDVILYCGSGGRAALAGKLLKDLGYEKVYNLGGFKDWADSGGEIEQ